MAEEDHSPNNTELCCLPRKKKEKGKKLTVKFNFVSCIHDFTIEQEKITFFRQFQ